jgi:hypothetical protein
MLAFSTPWVACNLAVRARRYNQMVIIDQLLTHTAPVPSSALEPPIKARWLASPCRNLLQICRRFRALRIDNRSSPLLSPIRNDVDPRCRPDRRTLHALRRRRQQRHDAHGLCGCRLRLRWPDRLYRTQIGACLRGLPHDRRAGGRLAPADVRRLQRAHDGDRASQTAARRP